MTGRRAQPLLRSLTGRVGSRRRLRTGRRAAGLGLLAAAVLTGCGPTPPQAPLAQAKKLDASLGGLSTACGLTYQVTAFAEPGHADVSHYEATASKQAGKLASVYARNPAWIYQGETVAKIVHDSISMLGSCGLTQAQAVLIKQTHYRRADPHP